MAIVRFAFSIFICIGLTAFASESMNFRIEGEARVQAVANDKISLHVAFEVPKTLKAMKPDEQVTVILHAIDGKVSAAGAVEVGAAKDSATPGAIRISVPVSKLVPGTSYKIPFTLTVRGSSPATVGGALWLRNRLLAKIQHAAVSRHTLKRLRTRMREQSAPQAGYVLPFYPTDNSKEDGR